LREILKVTAFDNIDHQILNKILKERLKPDRNLMGLLYILMKAGYLEGEKFDPGTTTRLSYPLNSIPNTIG